jgi:protein TonB
MYSEQNRAFSYAVLASIVLHGALLFGVSQRSRPQLAEAQPPPLVARLVEPAAPAPVAAAPQPPRVEPERPKPRPRAAPAPRPVAKAPPAPVAEPMPQPPAEKVASEERSEPTAPDPVPAAPAPEIARLDPAPDAQALPQSPSLPPPQSPRVAEPAPAAQPLAQYRLQLIGAARKHKRYPRLAMENNWEGDVVVRMAFGGNGLLAGLTIHSSSGYAVLDHQALEMFRQAAKMVEVPSALHGREFTFEVRAVYNLEDQDSG